MTVNNEDRKTAQMMHAMTIKTFWMSWKSMAKYAYFIFNIPEYIQNCWYQIFWCPMYFWRAHIKKSASYGMLIFWRSFEWRNQIKKICRIERSLGFWNQQKCQNIDDIWTYLTILGILCAHTSFGARYLSASRICCWFLI